MALKLPGVAISKEAGRVYPNSAAGTVLGYTTIDGHGVEGLELSHDKLLRGSGVRVAGVRDSYGRQLLVQGAVDARAAAGEDLVLSLDRYLTFVTEKALATAVEKHHAKAGMAVMMNPRTGEILAWPASPPTTPTTRATPVARQAKNRTITDEYEMGSTMKTFTFAAAFNAGKLRAEEMFDCQMGKMTIGKHTVHDAHPKGIISAAEVFKHSSNIGSIKIARRIGKEALYDTLVGFGFGRPTAIGLAGELRGTPAEREPVGGHRVRHGGLRPRSDCHAAAAGDRVLRGGDGGGYTRPGWSCAPFTPTDRRSRCRCRRARAARSG
jgi:cell division protein FtsI (penicillin-binding protein 3)